MKVLPCEKVWVQGADKWQADVPLRLRLAAGEMEERERNLLLQELRHKSRFERLSDHGLVHACLEICEDDTVLLDQSRQL